MEERETVDCSYLVNYLTGDCTEWERAAFERHLRTCVTCREELSELQDVWEALPFDMEEVEVPADLKGQVMQSLQPKEIEPAERKKKRSFMWIYGSSAAIVLGFVVGIWWNNQQQATNPIVKVALNQPAEIVHTFQLKSFDTTMPAASGTAYVLQNGDSHNVVINLQGLKETQGDWTYQVWYNRSGKRYNCGTLRVDEKGTGVLTYAIPVKVKDAQIDSFGVTLEPDPNGSTPRGKKILGT
jgi:anti-sigma-K factor RskA